MAGAGSRFANAGIYTPKPLIEVENKTLIEHSIKSFDVEGKFIFITRDFGEPHNSSLSNLLKTLRPESVEIKINTVTGGAVESIIAARDYIDNDEPLVVYNCDQKILWDSQKVLDYIENYDPDSLLVLYKSVNPANSFAEVSGRYVLRTVEKNPISDNALIGFHYWCKGRDFCKSADQLIKNYRESGTPECYVSETYNYLVRIIDAYFIEDGVYIPLGTPEDLNKYENR